MLINPPAIIKITAHAKGYLMTPDTLKCRILNCFNHLNKLQAVLNDRGCFIASGAPSLQWHYELCNKCLNASIGFDCLKCRCR